MNCLLKKHNIIVIQSKTYIPDFDQCTTRAIRPPHPFGHTYQKAYLAFSHVSSMACDRLEYIAGSSTSTSMNGAYGPYHPKIRYMPGAGRRMQVHKILAAHSI
jgi:hypothetical protein